MIMKAHHTFIDHTADVLFEAEAPTLEELFEQCAIALEETQVDVSSIKGNKEITITGKNKKIDQLLFDFLDDLVFHKDADLLIFNTFKIKINQTSDGYKLECKAKGDILDYKKHHPKVDVKAITMHMFEVKKIAGGWKAKVLVDI